MNIIFPKMALLVVLGTVISVLAIGVLTSVSAQNESELEQALKGTKENITLENMTGGAIDDNTTGGNATMAGSNATVGGNATG
jgi:hypothetical protein